MVKYRNEAAFSKAICAHLTELGYFVQRIETRETGRGVPDLYVGTSSGCYWIELKRIKQDYHSNTFGVQVPWRPGQQRWMYQHFRKTKVPCFTFIAFDNQLGCIAHTRMYSSNWIYHDDFLQIWTRVENVRL